MRRTLASLLTVVAVTSTVAAAPARAQSFLNDMGQLFSGVTGTRDLDDRNRERAHQAVRLCAERAENQVQRDGGRAAEVEKVRNVDVRGDRVRVDAAMVGRYEGRNTRGGMQCEVDFSGSNRIVAFDTDGLVKR